MGKGIAKTYRDLDVYQMALRGAIRVYELTKEYPVGERYSLVDQIRRSSRSVCTNTAEAWRKRRYKAAFVSKLSDAETEAAETQVHLEISMHCGYLNEEIFHEIDKHYDRILGKIVRMIEKPDSWLIK